MRRPRLGLSAGSASACAIASESSLAVSPEYVKACNSASSKMVSQPPLAGQEIIV